MRHAYTRATTFADTVMDAPNGKLNSLSQANINVLQATNKVFAALLTTNAVSYCLLRKPEN